MDKLRVGLTFNLKRIDPTRDDAEAEYDSPKTIESLSRAIESHGHQVVHLEANPDFPRALMTSGVDMVFNIAEGIRGRNREALVPSMFGLTMAGNFQPGGSCSRPVAATKKSGVGMPASRRMRLPIALSRVTQSAAGSEPV